MRQDPSVSCTGPCPIVEGDHHHHQLQVWAVLRGLAAQGRHPTHHLLVDGTHISALISRCALITVQSSGTIAVEELLPL